MDIRPVGNFASVVDAVRCAVEVQREMAGRNTDVPSDRRIEFRLGINVGDIIRDGRDIYRDGVNVAARLEALAEPGGICVSRVVHDQVCDKLTFSFAQQVNDLNHETCLRHRPQPGRLMCSYFIHFADDVAQEAAARVRQIAISKNARSRHCRATPGRYRPLTAILSIWSSGCADYSRKTLRKTLYYSASRRKLLKYLKKSRLSGSTRSSSISTLG